MNEFVTEEQIKELTELGCIVNAELVYGDAWNCEENGIGDDARKTWESIGVNEHNFVRLYYQHIRKTI